MSRPLPRRILVTGAAGLLGRAVASRLVASPDIDVVVATDVAAIELPGALTVQRDIRHGLGDLMAKHRIDAVIHHAFVIQESRRPEHARAVNVDATARLAADARACDVGAVVYPSSTTTYGAWPGGDPHTEEEPVRPLPGFTYSAHKAEVEAMLRRATASGGPDAVILRACIVLAPGAANFITASLALPLMPVVAGADPPMQFLHLDDYIAAVELALRAGRPGTWNVAGRGTLRWRELIDLAGSRAIPLPATVMRRLVDITWKLRLQSRSDSSGLALTQHPWLASTDRITRELGWLPRFSSRRAAESWAAGLRRSSRGRRCSRPTGEGPPH